MKADRERHRVRLLQAERNGHGRITASAIGPHGPLTVELTPRPGEPSGAFRERMACALRQAIVDQECCERRAAACATACQDLEVELERPGTCEFTVHDGLLEGWVTSPTASLLVVLAGAAHTREVAITPNKFNRFSLDLSGYRVVSITAVGPDGLHGPEQVAEE